MSSDELEYSENSRQDDSEEEERTEDEESEEQEAEQETNKDLNDALYHALSKNFDFAGNYYHRSVEPNAPNPILTIEGIGLIGLPLSERDAQMIVSRAAQAPFGKGDQTIVDTSVRDTWEIEPAHVSFQNPKWKTFVDETAMKVWKALGVAPNKTRPRCELYKLLLYQTGSHFLPHQDTAKAPGMFATVVIVLPSAFGGGAVHVSHAGRSTILDVSKGSILNTSVLAWYTDVVHEVKPITSGYRLALSYNLVYSTSNAPLPSPPSVPQGALENLRKALQKWKEDGYEYDEDSKSELPLHAYMLSHQYSQDDLGRGVTALKGKDAHLVSCIIPVIEEMEFVACLANVEKTEVGTGDDDCGFYKRGVPPMGEIEDSYIDLSNLVRISDGETLDLRLQKFRIEESCVVPRDAFERMAPTGKDYEGYQGNGAGGMSQWYHRSALVLFQKEDETLIVQSIGGPTALVRLLPFTETLTPATRKIVTAALKDLSNSKDAATLLVHALSWKQHAIWNKAIPSVQNLEEIDAALFEAVKVFGPDSIKPGLSQLIKRQKDLQSRLDVTKLVAEHLPNGMNTMWIKNIVKDALSSYSAASVADVPALVQLAQELEKGFAILATKVIPRTTEHVDSYNFHITLTKCLIEHRKQLPVPDPSEADSEASSDITALTRQSLLAAAAQWATKPPPTQHKYAFGRRDDNLSATVLTNRVNQMIELCFSIGDPSLGAQISQAVGVDHQMDVLFAIKAKLGNQKPAWVKDVMKAAMSTYSSPATSHIPILTWVAEVLGAESIQIVVTNISKSATYEFLMGLAKSLRDQVYRLMEDEHTAEEAREPLGSTIAHCVTLAIPHWEVGILVEAPKPSLPMRTKAVARRYFGNMYATNAVQSPTPAKRLLEIVEFCFSIDDLRPCSALFDNLLHMPDTNITRRFEAIHVPLLRELKEALAKRGQDPHAIEPFKSFFRGLISLYLGRIYPYVMSTTSLPSFPLGFGCGCTHCRRLGHWLPTTEAKIEFTETQSIRTHVESYIAQARINYLVACSTIKRGSSHYTLVVSKRPEAMPGAKRKEARAAAARFVQDVGGDQAKLKALMQDRYDDVVQALEGKKRFDVRKTAAPTPTTASSSTSQATPATSTDIAPQIAGVKRKRRNPLTNVIDVIDLT
ncbi:hypothetical protein BJ165DRAFT_1390309 [Panaeolus papilionaceus]|nr:hypothetical protein BJ165DRAFT_1390309 [Panaeolus papilionaceus]